MAIISTNLLLQILGVTIAFVGFVYAYLKLIVYKYWSSKGVAQLEPVAPFGSIWDVITSKKSMGELMREGYRRFKKNRIFGVYNFHIRTLVVCDPEIIRFILTKEFSSFQNRLNYENEKIDPLSNHLFFLPADKWKRLRTKFTPTFTSGKMKQMFETVTERADKLALYLEKEAEETKLFSIRCLMARFTTEIIASIAFGIDSNAIENVNDEFHVWGQKFFEPKPITNSLLGLCPSMLKTLKIALIQKEVENFFTKAFTDTVGYRRTNNVVRKDFLNLIIQLMDQGYVEGDEGQKTISQSEDSNDKITMMEGAAQAFLFWIAGFETSSTTATYCLFQLSNHQKIQDRLADEMNKVLAESGGSITYDSISKMDYLDKVVSETLRMYPVVPFLNRESMVDIEMLDTGVKIPKGTPIVIPVLGLQWDPEIYPEPEKFNPERFNKENIASRHRYAYLPFGEGPRNCIGMRFGLLQTKTALISVISKYRCLPGPNTKSTLPLDRGNLLHLPDGKVILRLEKR